MDGFSFTHTDLSAFAINVFHFSESKSRFKYVCMLYTENGYPLQIKIQQTLTHMAKKYSTNLCTAVHGHQENCTALVWYQSILSHLDVRRYYWKN